MRDADRNRRFDRGRRAHEPRDLWRHPSAIEPDRRAKPGRDFDRPRLSAHGLRTFHDEDAFTRPRERGGRDQAISARANHDGVEAVHAVPPLPAISMAANRPDAPMMPP